jgi:hypothetical protein
MSSNKTKKIIIVILILLLIMSISLLIRQYYKDKKPVEISVKPKESIKSKPIDKYNYCLSNFGSIDDIDFDGPKKNWQPSVVLY